MAAKKTRERIEYTFHWPTVQTVCQECVRSYRTCQLKKCKTVIDRVPITLIPRSDRVFDHFFLLILQGHLCQGPKPIHNYTLVIVDSFSHFPFCIPLKTLHVKSVF